MGRPSGKGVGDWVEGENREGQNGHPSRSETGMLLRDIKIENRGDPEGRGAEESESLAGAMGIAKKGYRSPGV